MRKSVFETVSCVNCEQDHCEGNGEYVTIGDDAVCVERCKFEFIENSLFEYLKAHDTLNLLNSYRLAILDDETDSLDKIVALRKALEDVVADETGQPIDTNEVNAIIGPMYDAEYLFRTGNSTQIAESLAEALTGVKEFTHPDATRKEVGEPVG